MISQTTLESTGILIARIMLGALFFVSGVTILTQGTAGTVMYFEGLGLPLAGLLVWIVVFIKILGGGALILGYKTKKAAAILFLFTAGTVLVAHLDPSDTQLWKNLAIMGGLLYAMSYGPGSGWRLHK